MKKITFLIVLVIIGLCSNAQSQNDTLTNSKIITLTKIGLPAETIITKIKTSITSFDVSVNALVELQKNGVNADVINEMMKVNGGTNVSVAKETNNNNNNPNVMHKQGIYYYNPNDPANTLTRVDASVTTSEVTGGGTYNGAPTNSTTMAELAGGNSKMQLNDKSPVFYFYFGNNSTGDSWFTASATSPKEFILIKLHERNKYRWVETASTIVVLTSVTTKTGIPERDKINFDYTQVSEGIYKVTFKQPLDKGEYSFMYANQTPSKSSNVNLFDFGISIE